MVCVICAKTCVWIFNGTKFYYSMEMEDFAHALSNKTCDKSNGESTANSIYNIDV